ncbi:hypothetical protein Goe5_c00180 [Bacillus phage vB_BthM-Goe5]|nr:hypothetical protein Goe5_c00180 [Bacillus phage vB_BthM-Goe5]
MIWVLFPIACLVFLASVVLFDYALAEPWRLTILQLAFIMFFLFLSAFCVVGCVDYILHN